MRFALAALLMLSAVPLSAQRQVDVKGSIGIASFLDESFDHHLLTGASARFYITRRFSIEPEVLYLRRGRTHSDIIIMPNVVWDFGGERVVPYVTGGIGLLRTSDGGFIGGFSHTEGTISVGIGTKIYLNDRWFVAPEARLGFEAHVRASVGVGYTWHR